MPFGGRVNWGANDNTDLKYPLTANGVQRWHMEDAALTFIQISAGAAYKIGPFAIGATGNFINSQINETEARSLTGIVDSTIENNAKLEASGNNGSLGVGTMLEAIQNRLWLAASYQSRIGGVLPGQGSQTLKGSFTFSNGPSPFYSQSGTLKQDIYVHESLPDIVRVGIRARLLDNFEVRLFGDLTRWSALTSQCINLQSGGNNACQVHRDGTDATPKSSVVTNIPRNWKDTYGAHLGASYWFSPAAELFAGVAYETAASPDSTIEPGSMDGNNVLMALGGRFLVANYFYMALSYNQIQFMNRNVTDSQLSLQPNGKSLSLPTFQQDGNGQYTQWIGVVDINLEKQF